MGLLTDWWNLQHSADAPTIPHDSLQGSWGNLSVYGSRFLLYLRSKYVVLYPDILTCFFLFNITCFSVHHFKQKGCIILYKTLTHDRHRNLVVCAHLTLVKVRCLNGAQEAKNMELSKCYSSVNI